MVEIGRTLRGSVNDCANGKTCPKIVKTSAGLAVVGTTVTDPDLLVRLGTAPHESVVLIPPALLPELS